MLVKITKQYPHQESHSRECKKKKDQNFDDPLVVDLQVKSWPEICDEFSNTDEHEAKRWCTAKEKQQVWQNIEQVVAVNRYRQEHQQEDSTSWNKIDKYWKN